MAANFIQTLAQASRQPAEVPPITSQNSTDMIRAALEGKADLSETIRRIMASGIGVQAISNIFTSLGIQQSSAVGAYIKAVGVMGAGHGIRDYAGTLDHRAGKEFLARAGHSGTSRPTSIPREAFDHAIADAYGSLSHEQRGEVLSHMLFDAGHEVFWDQMAAHGNISHDTAEFAKGMAARLPAETKKQQQALDSAIDNAVLSPEDRANAEKFKQSKEARKLAELEAKAKELEELAERSRKNNDKAAKDIEEQAKRARETADAYRAEQARLNPELAAPLQAYADQAKAQREHGFSSGSQKSAHNEQAEVAALSNNALAAVNAAVGANSHAEIEKLVLQDKTGEVAETAARAMISGSTESKLEAGKVLAANAVSLGVVGEKQVDGAKTAVEVVEAKKVEAVAVKGSNKFEDDDESMFSATPPIANKLAQMRSPKEEAVPTNVKTASIST